MYASCCESLLGGHALSLFRVSETKAPRVCRGSNTRSVVAKTGAHDVMHRRRLRGPIAIRRVTSLSCLPSESCRHPRRSSIEVEEGGGSYDTEADEDAGVGQAANVGDRYRAHEDGA